MEFLPRRCPTCQNDTIIGHGRRLRQSHDDCHDQIWIRRGLCRPCKKTFTILPDWLAPVGHYSLHCRKQACERIAAGDSFPQAVPQCKDPLRLPDPSTVGRWAKRRLLSVYCWVKLAAMGEYFFSAPTIVAWDLDAVCRILPMEARSP